MQHGVYQLDVTIVASVGGKPSSDVMKPTVMESIKQRVRRRFKDLVEAADGATINETALRSLLPQFFR